VEVDHFGNLVGDAAKGGEGDPSKLSGAQDRSNFWLPVGAVPLQGGAAAEGWVRAVAARPVSKL
jgi:hypothetical protein